MTKKEIIELIVKRTIDEWKMLQDMRNSNIFTENEINRQRARWIVLDNLLEEIKDNLLEEIKEI